MAPSGPLCMLDTLFDFPRLVTFPRLQALHLHGCPELPILLAILWEHGDTLFPALEELGLCIDFPSTTATEEDPPEEWIAAAQLYTALRMLCSFRLLPDGSPDYDRHGVSRLRTLRIDCQPADPRNVSEADARRWAMVTMDDDLLYLMADDGCYEGSAKPRWIQVAVRSPDPVVQETWRDEALAVGLGISTSERENVRRRAVHGEDQYQKKWYVSREFHDRRSGTLHACQSFHICGVGDLVGSSRCDICTIG